jgi:hypothetical protein
MSEVVSKLALALSKAQGEIKNASKDATNPHFRANYATLASVWDACRAALSKNEIAVIQTPYVDALAGRLFLRTVLLHSSGQEASGELSLAINASTTAQQLGSMITYLRRYGLSSMVGVAPDDDDDGNSAVNAAPAKGANKPVPQVKKGSTEQLKEEATAFVRMVEMTENAAELAALLAKSGPLLLDIKNRLLPDWDARITEKIAAKQDLLAGA